MQIQHMMKKRQKLRSAIPATQIDPVAQAERRARGPFFKKTDMFFLSILEDKRVEDRPGVRNRIGG